MALKSVFAFSVLFFFTYCEAKAENCSEARCKLLLVGGGFASEFRSKAFEKGVRMVYLHLKIGNDSYDPLESKDEFLSHRWVLASKITEPMLSLSYDYDILSLGLLTYQVRSVDVHLQDQPSGCLANLNSTSQDRAVGKVLLNETEHSTYGELPKDVGVVCVAVIGTTDFYLEFFEGNVRYHCCAKNKSEESTIQCDLVVKSSSWFKAFNGILNILTVVMILYCPAFLLALPDCIFNLRQEYEKDGQRGQIQDNNNGSGEDNQALSNSPLTSEYGVIKYDSGTSEADESDLLQRGNDYIQSQISASGSSSDSGSSVEQPQQPTQDQRIENSAEQRFVYLDDASPITCSTLFDKCAGNKFKADLIFFNVKLAFLWYFVIPIFCYVELWLNYTTKKEFFEEMSRKPEARLAGLIFSFLSSKNSLVLLIVSAPIILFSRPKDFKLNGKCKLCKGNDLLIGEEMSQHMEQILVKAQTFFFWLIKKHRKGIKKPIKCCTFALMYCFEPSSNFCRPLYTVCCLLCDAMVILFSGLVLGAVYFFLFLIGIVLLCVFYSPYFTLGFALCRKAKHMYNKQRLRWRFLPNNLCAYIPRVLFYWSALPFMSFYSVGIMENLTVVCLVGALSCRFIVKMFGYIIMGLVLNAEIASPFGTFVITASTNMYLCYYNLQKKYQEVKEMISQQWEKQKKDLLSNDDLSKSEEGTIPEDLFWRVCSDTSEHKVLPITPEIYRMFRNMVLILIFLVLALCSIIFLGKTYSISAVASTIAIFVTGVIPGLFFKGITKGNKFSGPTKAAMMRKIKKAVKKYIKERKPEPASQSQGVSTISEETNESHV